MTDQPDDIVDDDGHTLADITPWPIDEPEDTETAVNGNPDDPDEYANWDRDRDGGMWEYATTPDDEPQCQTGDNAEKGV